MYDFRRRIEDGFLWRRQMLPLSRRGNVGLQRQSGQGQLLRPPFYTWIHVQNI